MDRGARRSFLVGAGASNPRMRRKAPALLPGEGRNQKRPFDENYSGGATRTATSLRPFERSLMLS